MQVVNEFAGKVAVVTGGVQGIGRCIVEKFREAGAAVCVFDVQENAYFVGDLSREADLRAFCEKVIAEYGKVDFLVNNAAPLFKGLPDCSWDEFNYALQVGWRRRICSRSCSWSILRRGRRW